MGNNIIDMTAAGIARKIKDGDLSPVEVTEVFLERIRESNDQTKAFVTITENLAREMAKDAEEEINEGKPLGPLHGVPVAIKDLYDVEGVETTSGSKLFENRVAESDSPHVQRLKDAGAVIVGKTNTPEFGLGTTTNNLIIGPTSNPFDYDRVVGGSSGGAAAALADKMVPLAPGSDAGGSIRIPASLTGVYGLKPTYGLVPKHGRPNAFDSHTPFSHLGPMARTVEDAALSLDIMAGSHPRDPFSIRSKDNYLDAVKTPIDDFDIAFSPDLGIFPLESEVESKLEESVTAFEKAGANVERQDPDFEHTQDEILEAYYKMAKVRWQSLFDNLEDQGFDPRGEDRDRIRPYLRDLIMDADEPSTREYKQADVIRTSIFDSIVDLLNDYDLLVSATVSTTAFHHGEEPNQINGTDIDPLRGWVLTQPYNFTGQPAASIPAGLVNGLPIGMQIAGHRHADDKVISASAAFERVRPWHDDYPERTSR